MWYTLIKSYLTINNNITENIKKYRLNNDVLRKDSLKVILSTIQYIKGRDQNQYVSEVEMLHKIH